jgi:Histidine kinase-, DNA gyrase B-, and HSP90-like ATPase
VIETDPPYRMTIDLNAIDHLGVNLYSNVAAVLTEAVANAWDADASEVSISFDPQQAWIIVQDDGHGMTVNDVNARYLRISYQRRKEPGGAFSPKGRPVMGRKGLGKLSLYSVAETVEIHTCRGGLRHAFRIRVPDIRASQLDCKSEYFPVPIACDPDLTVGTRIRLTDLKRERLGATMRALPKRLARRFSVIGSPMFRVFVDGAEVTAQDRGDLEVVEFLWSIGSSNYAAFCPALKEQGTLLDRRDTWPVGWSVRGWIGTSTKPKQLETEAGNLNSIPVLARGRLLQENLLDRVNDGRLYTKYLTGQIEADFLDDDDAPDIATSDRQRVLEDDPRYQSLIEYLRKSLNVVESQWNEWRNKYGADEVTSEHPVVAEWLDALPPMLRGHAQKLIAKVGSIPVERDEDRLELLRHSVIAFERLRIRGSVDSLIAAIEAGTSAPALDGLLRELTGRDALEAALYHDIVSLRLDVIRSFADLTDKDAREQLLQRWLFNHLWLLDPAWERAAGSERMEKQLRLAGVILDEEEQKERFGRFDIAYKTIAGQHVIVELKRSGRKMKLLELVEQGQFYVDAVKEAARAAGEENPDVIVVFAVGSPIEEQKSDPSRYKAMMQSVSPGSRVVQYEALIQGALRQYQEYLDVAHDLDKLDAIVRRL